MPDIDNIITKDNEEIFAQDSPDYGKKIRAVSHPETNIGLDTDNDFFQNLILEGDAHAVDIGQLNSFTQLSQNREQLYLVLDTMAQDSTIAAVLETYAEDATQLNDQGKIVWAEASDSNIQKYVTFLLESLNVDKFAYKWVYSLCKYGDLYLRLFRRSDFEDDLFDGEDKNQKTSLNEKFTALKEGEALNEDVRIKAYSQDDKLVNYVEMVPNPAEMFELTRFGKSYAYIKTNSIPQAQIDKNSSIATSYYTYKFRRRDVDIYNAVSFVHAALMDDAPRAPEKIELFMNNDINSLDDASLYTVNRGQSILYNSYKIWREMMLLENALLLNRITKSSILRVIEVEVADMEKNDVRKKLQRIKQLVEQKASINEGNAMEEYVNPGAMENNIYVPTHDGIGAIQTQQIGGDVNVKDIADIDFFKNKLFASLKVPKQYFGECLRGNTPILLLNGQTRTIEYLFEHQEEYIGKGIMACNIDGSLQPTVIKEILLTKPATSFLRVHFDNGKFVDVTDNHKMMLRDGSFIRADELEVGDSLMPYYDKVKQGRRYVLDNATGKYKPQYRVVAESVCDIPSGYQVHHKNRIKIDDDFDNLVPLTLKEHYEEHVNELHQANKDAYVQKKAEGIASALEGQSWATNGIENIRFTDISELPEGFIPNKLTTHRTEEGKERVREVMNGPKSYRSGFAIPGESRDKAIANSKAVKAERRALGLYDEQYKAHSENCKAHPEWHEKATQTKLANIPQNRVFKERYVRCLCCGRVHQIKQNQDWYDEYLTLKRFWYCSDECKKINSGGKLARSYNLLKDCDFDYGVYEETRWDNEHRPDTYLKAETLEDRVENYITEYNPECNHKVVAIECLDVIEPAYDINVASDCHTFALPCGIFVHNCEDNAGFNGGTSLSIISSRYARTVVRIQNAMIQMLTDAINILLIDRGLDNYVNNFSLHMQAPVTQEELDKREAKASEIQLTDDIMRLLGDIEDPLVKFKALKSMLSEIISNTEVIELLQDYIDKLESEDESSMEAGEELDDMDFGDDFGGGGGGFGDDFDFGDDFGDTDFEDTNMDDISSEASEGGEDSLPSPSDLGVDLTDM